MIHYSHGKNGLFSISARSLGNEANQLYTPHLFNTAEYVLAAVSVMQAR